MDLKTRLLSGAKEIPHRQATLTFPDGESEPVWIWAIPTDEFFAIQAASLSAQGDLDTRGWQVRRVMACLRDGPPPEGKPIVGDWRDRNEFARAARGLSAAVVLSVNQAIAELSGFGAESLSFTEAETVDSPAT